MTNTARPTEQLMSVRGYARRHGVQPNSIRHAVKNGVIRLVGGKVDRQQADQSWAAQRRARNVDKDPGRETATARIRKAKARLELDRDRLTQLRDKYVNRAAAIKQHDREGRFVLERLTALPDEQAASIAGQLDIEPDAARELLTKFITAVLDELGDLPKSLVEISRRA